MATLGATLRNLRHERRCTLQEVSDGSGLTPSFLSRLERGIVNISVGNLRKIAAFFGVPITQFFTEEMVPHGIVIRAGARPVVEGADEKVRRFSLLPSDAAHLLAEVITIAPGGTSGSFRTTASRSLFYVLAGAVMCGLDGQAIRLSSSDVLYQRRSAALHWSSEGGAATLLFVSLQSEER